MTDSINQLPADHAAREKAVEDLSRNYFVEAAAGTGKTTALIGRIVNLIVRGNVPVERIAAITFTENATREFRERIRSALRARLHSADVEDGAAGERIRTALANLPFAQFSTIHGFCAAILREFAVEAGIDPDFEVAETTSADTLELNQFWRDWLMRQPPDLGPLLGRLQLARISTEQLRTLAFELVSKRAWLDAAVPEPADNLELCLARIEQLTEQLAGLLDRACTNPKDALYKALIIFVEKIREAQNRETGIEERQLALKNIAWDSSAKVTAKNWTTVQDGERAQQLAEEIDKLLGALYHEQVLQIVEWLKGFVAYYLERRRSQGQLDFDELLIRARDLVRRDKETRRALQRRFAALLVDEFQDTDPLQIEIVWFLCEAEPLANDWRDAILQPGKLFVVGDPKQSIFRFRKADIEIYQQARKSFAGDEQVQLNANFRCTPQPLQFVNALFTPLIQRPPGEEYQPDYVPLFAQRAGERHGRTIYLCAAAARDDASPAKKVNMDEYRQREAELIARWIALQLRAPTLQVRDRASGELRAPRPGDFALLFRGVKQIQYYEDALRGAGIDYHLLGGQTFYRSPAVQVLLHLAGAADQPGSALHFVCALRTPVFACADDAIYLCHARHGLQPARLAQIVVDKKDFLFEPVLSAARQIMRWHGDAQRLPVSQLLEKMIDDTGMIAHYGTRRGAARQIANLRKAVELARQLEAAGRITLGAVCDELQGRRDFETLEEESLAAEESGDAARLLTMHKAKGLEYPIVILADLFSGAKDPAQSTALFSPLRGNAEYNLGRNVMTAGFPERLKRERILSDAESIRLLYVAATRAREHLVVPWAIGESELSHGDKFGRLSQFFTQSGFTADPRNLVEQIFTAGDHDSAFSAREMQFGRDETIGIEVQALRISGVAPDREAWFHYPFLAAAKPDDPRVEAMLAARRAWCERLERLRGDDYRARRILTPSAEAHHAAPEDRPRGETEVSVAGRDSGGKMIGTVVHQVLEQLQLPDAGNLPALLATFAVRENLDEAQQQQTLELLTRLIASADFTRIRRANQVFREVPFCVESEGLLIEGVIDCLFEADERLWIVDYKTDRIPPGGIDELREQYAAQCRAYRRAVESGLQRPLGGVYLFILRADPPQLIEIE